MDNETKEDGKRAKDDLFEYFHRPCFRKIFLRDINFFAVRIPTTFVDQLENKIPDTATLTVSSGSSWQIKVVKGEDGVSLEDGWPKFRDDNNLAPGEVLLFRYFQNMCFNVQIFSPNGMERKIGILGEKGKEIQQRNVNFLSHGDKRKIDCPRENEEAGPSTVRRKRGRPRKENNSGAQASNTKRASWKVPNIAKLFLDLCLKEVPCGCNGSSTMKGMPWQKIRLTLMEEKGIDLSENQLMNHWGNEKRRYKIWLKVLEAAGNAHYDPIENKINWSTMQWKEHFQINPEATQLAYRSLEYSKEMMMLFGAEK